MLQMSYDVAQLVAQERLDRDFDRVLVGCRLCEAGLRQRGWLARQVCRAVCAVGRGLVATGQRLEQFNHGAHGQIRLARAPRGD